MTLDEFIESLQELQKQGYGDLEVFYRHGASGDCGELSTSYVDDKPNEMGPFDMEGKQWIEVYAGN